MRDAGSGLKAAPIPTARIVARQAPADNCDVFHSLAAPASRPYNSHECSTGADTLCMVRLLTHRNSRRSLVPALLICLGLLLAACGGGEETAAAPEPTLAPEVAAGEKVFVAHCGACHSPNPGTVIVGPSLAGMATTGATRVDGLDARAYVYNAILQPSDYLVSGFDDLMPKDLAKKLTGEELDSVVAYVLSLE